MAKVLLFNFQEEQRRKKVKAVLFRLGIPSREVAPEEQNRRIGELAGMPAEMLETVSRPGGHTEPLKHHGGQKKRDPGETGPAAELHSPAENPADQAADCLPQEEIGKEQAPFQEEMIVMLGLNARQFHGFLDGIRTAGVRVPLKAMATEHNIAWTARELHRELAAEHASMNP